MDDFRRIVAWTPDPTLRPAVSALRSLTLVSCAGDDVLCLVQPGRRPAERGGRCARPCRKGLRRLDGT